MPARSTEPAPLDTDVPAGRRVAFVLPRFGESVVGGAEAVGREAAMGLARRGWDVEVLTTCAIDHTTWKNVLPPGAAHEDGVLVRRFPAVRRVSGVARHAQDVIEHGGHPPLDDQLTWLGLHFSAPALFHHLVAAGDSFSAVVFMPYLYWTTSVGMQAVPDRTVVVPCLHDELYAELEVFRPVLSDARSVWFLSEPEHELAHRLGPVTRHHVVTGAGVAVPDPADGDGFRRQHRLERPFLLFAGRRERDKGWPDLLELFGRVVDTGLDVDLVTIGVGDATAPPAIAGRVHDLGLVSTAGRDAAFAAALCYVSPGRMESFSRTAMEAWLAETPVLATADGAVVAWHCRRSGGGLLYADPDEFVKAVSELLRSPDTSRALGAAGRRYVLEQYQWDTVLDRMEADLVEAPWAVSS